LSACARRKDDSIAARVGPIEITKAEFQQKLNEVAPEYQNYVLTASGRKQFLEILVREKLILAAAKDDHIASTEEFGSEVEKLKAEQRRRLKEFEEYLLTKLWIENLRQKGVLKVTDEEIAAYHDANPREIQLRHILVADPKHGEELLKRLRHGNSFNLLAKAESLDQDTAAKGGKLPPLLRGEVLPELEDAAFKMRTNETVGLVQSKFGYHILRKDSDRPVSLESVKERIRKLLEKQKLDRFLASLQDRYPVEVVDAQLK
jgi:parvulin-like peptidyl-prolyl isomerase